MIKSDVLEHGQAIAKAAHCNFIPHKDRVISRVDGGKLCGGVIYTNYTGCSVSSHIAGFTPYWINRTLLWAIFDYPFNRLGCERVFAPTPSFNLKTIEFAKKLGFIEEAKVRGVFPHGDLIIMAMDRPSCRWLGFTGHTFTRSQ